jgi:hypothetical protein
LTFRALGDFLIGLADLGIHHVGADLEGELLFDAADVFYPDIHASTSQMEWSVNMDDPQTTGPRN